MSSTTVIYPIVTALLKAEEVIGTERAWQPTNHTQALFLSEFFAPCRQESLSITEIESIASFVTDDINHFLRERGFEIQLAPFENSDNWKAFGVASVLDLLFYWSKPGMWARVEGLNGKFYPAVQLGTEVSSFYQSTHHNYPIARLKTKSSDLVYMTRLDKAPADFELLHYAQQISGSLRPIYDYTEVIFPMVDLKQKVDISWLLNLATFSSKGEPVKITQALQETRLTINHDGARAKSVAAVGYRALGIRPPRLIPKLIIDRPFLIWFQRPGLRQPLFVGHITEEDWKSVETL